MVTKNNNKKNSQGLKLPLIITASVIMMGIILVLGAYLYLEIAFKNKFFPNTFISGEDMSGKTKEEALEIITAKMQTWEETPLTLVGDEKIDIVKQDLNIEFDLNQTVNNAYSKYRKENFLVQVFGRFPLFFSKNDNPIVINNEESAIGNITEQVSQKSGTKGVGVGLVIESGGVKRTDEKIGKVVNAKKLKAGLASSLESLDKQEIKLSYTYIFPNTNQGKISELESEIEKMLGSSLVLVYEDKKWNLDKEEVAKWIIIQEDVNQSLKKQSYPTDIAFYINDMLETEGIVKLLDNNLTVSLDEEKMKAYLDKIAEDIDIPSQNAVLSVADGKVIVAQPAKNGRALDRENARFRIIKALQSDENKVTLTANASVPPVREDNLEELGIKELIGQGKSDFSNSSSARIHNIKIGASKFNGVLVAPNEEFSFNKYLGPVDASTGFLPELVIKPGKLVKEYGGGLCQVATTAFRAALYSGTPITERKNHSFVVSHYFWPFKSAGTDATIYPPHPDLRFKNDTDHYILIQTYSDGNKLFFDFYGTKDGRESTIDGPYDVSRGTDGSLTTVFYRNVLKDGALVRRDTFNSYYKPAGEFQRVTGEDQ